jgi:hypothetical protein
MASEAHPKLDVAFESDQSYPVLTQSRQVSAHELPDVTSVPPDPAQRCQSSVMYTSEPMNGGTHFGTVRADD